MAPLNTAISTLIAIVGVSILIAAQDHGGGGGEGEAYEEDIEYTPYDGWYNNFAHPDWGAAETPLLRLLPHAYGDGVYKPSGENRPNPIAISQIVFNGSTGERSHRNRTALLVFFGQQVVEEILDAQRPGCPPEYFNIKIPKGHPEFDPNSEGGREMPLLRNRFDQRTGLSPNVPREQLNEISSYFDGTLMYGPNKAWADALRLFKGGRLKATNDTANSTDSDRNFPALNDIRLPYANPPPPRDHYLKPVNRFFTIGNPRGNENPFLLTFGILWFRYHNFKAHQIEAAHPTWSDEKIFNEARKWTIATHQKIVYYDWLPAWLNETLPEYKGYNPHVHPQIAHVFQSAAMRFGHTLVPPGVLRRNKDCVFRQTTNRTMFAGHLGLRTCNTYWNPQEAVREYDIDEILMGMASQVTEREDNIITPDLRGNVFGTLDFSRRDLMAVNIQRGRDHGLPDYNTAREVFGLPRRTNFSQINPDLFEEDPKLFEKLEELYGEDGINNLDIWPAGIMETTAAGPGELFRAIIKNQFERIRDADRFWFENYENNKLFTEKEIADLLRITLKDIIISVTNIGPDDIQDNPFFFQEGDKCPAPQQLHHGPGGGVEGCTLLKSIDYFDGSQASYIGTLILIFGTIIPAVAILILIAKCSNKKTATDRPQDKASNSQEVSVLEWMGIREGKRPVTILMDCSKKQILVKEESKLLRIIDITLIAHNGTVAVSLSGDLDMKMMSIRVPKEYDMVLNFKNSSERQEFLNKLKTFLRGCGDVRLADPTTVSEKMMKSTAITRGTRQAKLEAFFDAIFSHALSYKSSTRRQSLITSDSDANDIVNCELTKFEFAEALGLKPDSMFVENMFKMVDTNDNGYISFREFLDFFVIFSKGTPDEKAKLMFDMYDLRRSGKLSKEDFKMMLKSMVELTNEKVEDDKIDQLSGELFLNSRLESKSHITFEDFKNFLKEYEDELDYSSLSFQFGDVKQPTTPARRENAPSRARKTIIRAYGQTGTNRGGFRNNRSSLDDVKTIQRKEPTTSFGRMMNSFVKYFENYRRQIFWATLYTLVVAGIFIERAYYYSFEREYSGLRRSLGYGVTITRGAASAMMFTYSSMLVTMCKSIIALLRETFLNRFIPFDSAVAMHRFIGYQALIYTISHVIGHCFNFYHLCTQPPGDLGCLFRNFHHPTNYLPKFTDWAWDTITGCTGILMTLQLIFIYVYSTEYARRKAFRAFWLVHSTYPVFFILMIMHGAGRFIQAPFLYYFFLGPVILYTIDRLISISRNKIEISVVKSELLPSDVTYLELRKPPNFEYRSGQWIRIACLAHSGSEYHPFTITSAPHENHLSVHIRAVGPWTRNVRKLYDPRQLVKKQLPKVFVDGPYGEGHQDWSKYEVSVLIGGGIGVTPFASILKDIAHRSEKGQMGSVCKKVYFIWVTRTQRHFEWMTDIIREVEQKDLSNIVVVNTFITQFQEKFDFRTTMLYICERHFQKISDRSLFTGLRSVTHFGRPDFSEIFKVVMKEHPATNVFGVFSCGPPPMTRNVEQACSRDNAYTSDVLFVHHHENF